MMAYSREELLDHLEAYYWRTGELATSKDIQHEDSMPAQPTYTRHFYSISHANREMVKRLEAEGVKVG